ncbi:hypothetical protein CB1_056579138 [Camelus ferus]|nr:hypothetical protein CB1_056579138 [Camelus ferus]
MWEAVARRVFGNDLDDAKPEQDRLGAANSSPRGKTLGLSLSRVSFGLIWTTCPAKATSPEATGILEEVCSWAPPAAVSTSLSLERKREKVEEPRRSSALEDDVDNDGRTGEETRDYSQILANMMLIV